MLTPAILFYGTTLTGTGFLSVLLWFEKKEKITLSLAIWNDFTYIKWIIVSG